MMNLGFISPTTITATPLHLKERQYLWFYSHMLPGQRTCQPGDEVRVCALGKEIGSKWLSIILTSSLPLVI